VGVLYVFGSVFAVIFLLEHVKMSWDLRRTLSCTNICYKTKTPGTKNTISISSTKQLKTIATDPYKPMLLDI